MLKYLLIPLFLFMALQGNQSMAQKTDLTDYKIFINPGHGGHDSDDRHMLATDFWESDGNLEKGLFLRQILVNMHATVYMSRTTNYTEDDLPLSAIDAMANSANVDFFLSIHSNGFDGKENKPLMLFRGYDDQPVFPAARTMAMIMWQKLFEKGNCWTNNSIWVKGDWTFYPEWGDKVGLGVLRTLTMPGVLSEGSFHDYIPESWRLRNKDFLDHEAWAFTRSIIEYENVVPLSHGVIAGIIRDPLKSPSWYFKPGTNDEASPLNGAIVTLTPGNETYHVDDLNNGFYLFDSIPPGDYKVKVEGIQDYFKDSLNVTVTANKTVLADFAMQFDTTIVPGLTSVMPSMADSLLFNQEFTFTFDLPMDRDSVQKALLFDPSVELSYAWNEKGTVLRVKPTVSFTGKSAYVIRLTRTACSEWKVPIAEELQFNFITKSRTRLKLERSFPKEGITEVSLYPQIRLYFDAPLDHTSVPGEIQLLDPQNQPLSKLREGFVEAEGKGVYYFELSQPLELNKHYKLLINAAVADVAGISLGENAEINFTSRTSSYESGAIIEPFDDLARFWDPDASGSTIGTDNPLTTFTASPLIKRAGSNAGRLDYVFINATGGVCRVFDTQKPGIGQNANTKFGIWVFGDMSMNILEYWFYSSGTTNQIVYVDTVDWAGWDLKTIPFNVIGGTGDRQYHSVVIRQSETGSKSGVIFFDEAMLITPTGINELRTDDFGLGIYPNPLSSSGGITFSLREKSMVTLEVFTLDGRKGEQIINELLDPGPQYITWVPSPLVNNGIYLIRLTVKTFTDNKPVTSAIRCVLSR